VNATDLGDEQVEQIRDHVSKARKPIVFVVQDFAGWPHDARSSFLALVAEHRNNCRVAVDDEDRAVDDPFAAVLEAMVSDSDILRCTAGRNAAVYAAALFHPNAITAACNRIAGRLRDLGIRGIRVSSLEKEVRQLVTAMAADDSDVVPVVDMLPTAPVTAEATVPPGWKLGTPGITRVGETGVPEIPSPVIISARLRDAAEGTECLQLSWFRDGNWQLRIVDRAQIANSRAIVELAGVGLPVTSNNASELVQFLSEYEAINADIMPVAKVTGQMGWQGHEGTDGFLVGRSLITADGSHDPVDLQSLAPGAWPADLVTFRGADAGDEQLADGFHSVGSLSGWLDAIAVIEQFPRLQLAIYASLAPPMLSILDSPNFVVDFCGETSEGKTTTLRVAASVWGNPDERSPAAALSTWDSTRVWIERASAVLNGLPLILDDTKRARRPRDVAQTLYDATSGRGRGRGSPRGMGRANTWTTVLISSGEAPATSFTEDGGTRARVLTLWGSPFGEACGDMAVLVNGLNDSIQQHFGHAGRAFVRFLQEHRHEWPAWKETYRAALQQYRDQAGDDKVGCRLAQHFAMLRVTALMAHEALLPPWTYADPIAELWDVLVAEFAEADRASSALRQVVSWARANRAHFFESYHAPPPSAGWAGKWSDSTSWTGLMFFEHKLRELLKDAGFDYEATMRSWRARGWLYIDGPSGKARRRARVAGENVWLISINRDAVEAVESGSNE
jgi:hypothetical protein